MILYFSGTGNSRYVAEMIADLISDKAVDITTYLKQHTNARFVSEKPWVFVCPVYVSAPAKIFTSFIKKSIFEGNKKAYFIMTCAGGMGAAPVYCENLAKRMRFEYMGTSSVDMPQNYITYFHTKPKDVCDKIILSALPHIRELALLIERGQMLKTKRVKLWELYSTKAILDLYYKVFMKASAFEAGDHCTGCGKCERVCPLNNIKMVDRKPTWGKDCTHCMACINLCPSQAIEYGKWSKGKPRYQCPKYQRK